ncbi:DLL1 [Branchiostoma lanceolatum]|uniref:DLL1 protein n=1 Tax=Branchiostoma lanceolatum TaxID=7740 RepID=A0A8J9Z6Z4_BRALA|nr:DLL1 [Branchiostoma lanceolatum]
MLLLTRLGKFEPGRRSQYYLQNCSSFSSTFRVKMLLLALSLGLSFTVVLPSPTARCRPDTSGYCLNGGRVCGDGNSGDVTCACSEGFIGPRCQQKDFSSFGSPSSQGHSRENDVSSQDDSRETDASSQSDSRETDASSQSDSRETDASLQRDSRETDASSQGDSRETDASSQDDSRETDASSQSTSRETDASSQRDSRETDAFTQDDSRETDASSQGDSRETDASSQGDSRETDASTQRDSRETDAYSPGESRKTDASSFGYTTEIQSVPCPIPNKIYCLNGGTLTCIGIRSDDPATGYIIEGTCKCPPLYTGSMCEYDSRPTYGGPISLASSQFDSRHSADRADINSRETAEKAGAWAAVTNDLDQWLLRDLIEVKVVTAIMTKGRNYSTDWPYGSHDQYVTSYVISYGSKNGDEKFYTNAEGEIIVFQGNSDRNTKVYHDFGDYSGLFTARFIKIHPRTWHGWIAMRVKIFTDENSTQIQEPPSPWSASSQFDSRHSADRADINSRETAEKAGAWAAVTNNLDQWLMRDLGEVKVVTGIITKGRNYSTDWPHGTHDQYVTSYVISYGYENGDEKFYTNAEGEIMVFQGNSDRNTTVHHDFGDYGGPVTARFIKIRPRTWHEWIAMRVKIVTDQDSSPIHETWSASSQFDSRHSADRADINSRETAEKAGAWAVVTNDLDQWLMRDLGEVKVVTGIITKGRNFSPDWPYGPHDQYVTSYVISYGSENGDEKLYTTDVFSYGVENGDEKFYTTEGEVIVFQGNTDRNTEVHHDFGNYSGPITARFIKILPRTWHEWIAMRVKIVCA